MSNLKSQISNRYKYFFILLVAAAIVLVLLVSNPLKSWVNAQLSGQSLEVSPPSQEISGDPGSTIQVKAKIRNASNGTLPISVGINDFTASGDQGQVALTDGGPWSVSTWTTI